MPIYSLYLNTADPNAISNTDTTIISWIVDFDNLFRKENYNYKKCKLRFKIVSRTSTLPVPSIPKFKPSISYLSCSLSSNYNATNLMQPTLLNTMVLVDSPATAVRQWIHPNANTMENVGTSINIPKGIQQFTISIGDSANFASKTNFGSLVGATQYNLIFQYHILLQFELYDKIF